MNEILYADHLMLLRVKFREFEKEIFEMERRLRARG